MSAVYATSSEVGKPFQCFVFLTVTHHINRTWRNKGNVWSVRADIGNARKRDRGRRLTEPSDGHQILVVTLSRDVWLDLRT